MAATRGRSRTRGAADLAKGAGTIDHEGTADSYEAYYGLKESPFSLNPDPKFLFDSRSHAAALELVTQAFRRREAVVVITGEIGTGKTVLCRTVLQRLPRRTFLSVITDPLLSSGELLQQVLQDFGILSKDHSGGEQPSQHQLVRTLERFLASLIPLQAHAVIMIDEAQHMRPEVLEQIRLLSNFETDNSKLLQVILVGQPDLGALLARPELRQLEQRVTHRTELLPLEPAEIEYYIERRLWIAHGSDLEPTTDQDRVRFLPSAMAAVAACSRGLPRVVNLLCDRALEDAFHRRKKAVDLRSVLNAADDLQIAVPKRVRLQPYRWAAAAAAVVVLGTGAWFGARALGWNLGPKTVATAPAAPAADAAPDLPAPVAMPTPEAGALPDAEAFSVLVASFRTKSRAARVGEQVTALGLPGHVRTIPGDWQQVLVGPFATREEAQDALDRLTAGQLAGGSIVSAPATGADPAPTRPDRAIARVALLPAPDRTSLVIDLGEDASEVNALITSADDRSLEVAIGPVRQPVPTLDLRPSSSGLIDGVSVRRGTNADGTVARISVTARGPMSGTVRSSKGRVYIDMEPVEGAPVPVEASAGAAGVPARTLGTASTPPAGGIPAAPAAGVQFGAASGEEWERALADRARELAKIPDVRGIQRLRSELLVRRGRPPDEAPIPAPGDKTMTEVIGYLEVAQKLQLTMDARLLREAQEKDAR